MFIKDTGGKRSLTATMAFVSFVVVMFKVLLSGASVSLMSVTFSFGSIDGFTIGAIFTPILGAYTARRWGQDDSYSEDAGGKPRDGAE